MKSLCSHCHGQGFRNIKERIAIELLSSLYIIPLLYYQKGYQIDPKTCWTRNHRLNFGLRTLNKETNNSGAM